MTNKTCSGCKWLDYAVYDFCRHPTNLQINPNSGLAETLRPIEFMRSESADCGPAARWYEARKRVIGLAEWRALPKAA
jgi:hypothetical protein